MRFEVVQRRGKSSVSCSSVAALQMEDAQAASKLGWEGEEVVRPIGRLSNAAGVHRRKTSYSPDRLTMRAI